VTDTPRILRFSWDVQNVCLCKQELIVNFLDGVPFKRNPNIL